MIDFYPRSPRGERRDGPDRPAHIIRISIHAPRVGSDYFNSGLYFICQISIPAPRVGSDGNQIVSLCPCEISIHAPRVGSDPIISTAIKRGFRDFYPRSPRGERLGTLLAQREADGFLSTLPAWGATKFIEKQEETNNISIHAPRVGSDGETVLDFTMGSDFYPRSPRGERQIAPFSAMSITKFLSTLPAWGATLWPVVVVTGSPSFLSTLPAWGATGKI